VYGLPWEAPENVGFWSHDSSTGESFPNIMVCRSISPSEQQQCSSIETKPTSTEGVGVLLLVARKTKVNDNQPDIDYRLNGLPLQNPTDGMKDFGIRLRIARPGTYQSFESALRERRYDVVYLDLHGSSKPGEHAKLGFTAPTPALAERGEGLEWVVASRVAKELAKHEVPLVVLNACESASGGAGVSNLAAVLVRQGVQAVIGMTQSILGIPSAFSRQNSTPPS